jgi:SpoVK/Ycf46/Vps4 family AAA+-type ATPase
MDSEADWPGFRVDIGGLDFDRRRRLWIEALPANSDDLDDAVDSVAAKFRLGVEGIRRAGEQAVVAARWRDPSSAVPSAIDLHAAARNQSTPILSGLARKITPHYRWDDLILPADALDQLQEISARVEHRYSVYESWGFERKLSLSRGVIALLAGNSGTGKTMAADVMANALGLDLYRIDLSAVVSKYIGETEKNLDAIFREAERSNAILFFDEADALFGKRSEVKDAHDRYANIETAYLLQRMEEYSGIVILATNLKMNLDEAFVRRLHFVVDFPMPDEPFRKRIWEGAIPPEAPLGEDIDWDFLARQFKVSGGNIKNAVVAGAFLAAGEGRPIEMSHLVRGMRREYQKLGRMVTDAEFGKYSALFQG